MSLRQYRWLPSDHSSNSFPQLAGPQQKSGSIDVSRWRSWNIRAFGWFSWCWLILSVNLRTIILAIWRSPLAWPSLISCSVRLSHHLTSIDPFDLPRTCCWSSFSRSISCETRGCCVDTRSHIGKFRYLYRGLQFLFDGSQYTWLPVLTLMGRAHPQRLHGDGRQVWHSRNEKRTGWVPSRTCYRWWIRRGRTSFWYSPTLHISWGDYAELAEK